MYEKCMQTSKLQNETNIQIQLFLLHYPSDTASRIILTFSESSLFQHASYINQKYQSISSIHFLHMFTTYPCKQSRTKHQVVV